MLYFVYMDIRAREPKAQALQTLADAYKAYKEKMNALESQQQALLHEAMGLLQESRMGEARKKLEAMLH